MNRSYKSSLLLGFVITLLTLQCYPASINIAANSSNGEGIILASTPSHYIVNQSVYYDVEIDFTLTHIGVASQAYYFKVSRLISRLPETSEGCPPYQNAELRRNDIQGAGAVTVVTDEFGNVFDQFTPTLNQYEKITLTQRYRVTLSEIYFQGITDADIGTYDTTHPMFNLYVNRDQQYFERSNANLIALSNSIVSVGDNPIIMAGKIFNWTVANLNYIDVVDEMGALWAFNNGGGDCSDYSDLMITLLRIQGVPARKVVGYIFTNDPAQHPKPKDNISFQMSYDGLNSSATGTLMGHAWLEYFVPNIGWIAVDPLWGEGGGPYYYFNRIDFLRFNSDVGAWFSLPPSLNCSEFPLLTSPVTVDHSLYTAEWSFRIVVANPMEEIVITLVIVSLVISSVLCIIALVMHKKNISIRDLNLKKLNLKSIEIPSMKARLQATSIKWNKKKTRRHQEKFKKLSKSIHDTDKRSKLQKFTDTSKEIVRGLKLEHQNKRLSKRIDRKLEELKRK